LIIDIGDTERAVPALAFLSSYTSFLEPDNHRSKSLPFRGREMMVDLTASRSSDGGAPAERCDRLS
jgi:hypothetical protein